MARYAAHIPSSWPADATFAYLADFSSTQEWDPGIARASRLDAGDVNTGSRFEVVARFLGRDVALVYEVTDIDVAARRITLRGTNATTVSVDTITVAGDATVTYEADLSLKGVLGPISAPVLGLLFKRLGDRAADGLRKTLASTPPRSERTP